MDLLVASTPAVLLLGGLLVVIGILLRRADRRATGRTLAARGEAREHGSHAARLQHPVIDLDQCIGCGACVRACPEEGVLAMAHGQAVVVHGARCVGHGRCVDACPAGAVAVHLADIAERRDLPAIDERLEAVGQPGLFVAGELTGHALVRTAVTHGTAVADAVANRTANPEAPTATDPAALDLLIVGAGPAGLACALRAREHGLHAALVDQAPGAGGAVASYPRAKLVMTQPMDLPLHGRLSRLEYRKEELIELWDDLVDRHQLDFRPGVRLLELGRERADTPFVARTSTGDLRARHVCLALGRRGTPRRLGVPGEHLSKVRYALLDAAGHQDQHVLVVGGGDSAIEAAIGLAAQAGNHVTLSYRKPAFFRLKARNHRALDEAAASGALDLRLGTVVTAIDADRVTLRRVEASQPGDDNRTFDIANDLVFVFAGGDPPFPLLERAGVSFDPEDRPPPPTLEQPGNGLLLAVGMLCTTAAGLLVFMQAHGEYYALDAAARVRHPDHEALRPVGSIGLAGGLIAVGAMACNLAYLLRRSLRFGNLLPGTLRTWMNAHVLTGLGAFLAAALHAGFAPRTTVGGHAFTAFAVVVVTGVIGRWLYAFVPRRANGSAMDAEDLTGRLAELSQRWDQHGRGFGKALRDHIDRSHEQVRNTWGKSLPRRLLALAQQRHDLARQLRRLRARGRQEGVPVAELDQLIELARDTQRLHLASARHGELHGLMASWRYLHRWLALLLVTLTTVHIVTALRYAHVDWRGLGAMLGLLSGGRP